MKGKLKQCHSFISSSQIPKSEVVNLLDDIIERKICFQQINQRFYMSQFKRSKLAQVPVASGHGKRMKSVNHSLIPSLGSSSLLERKNLSM